jgi:hypothetical protein
VDGGNGVQQAGFYSNALNCLHLLLCKGQARGMLDCKWGQVGGRQSGHNQLGPWEGSLPFITRRRCSCTTNPGLDCRQAQALLGGHCICRAGIPTLPKDLSFITHLRLPC